MGCGRNQTRLALALASLFYSLAGPLFAQPLRPLDVGATVNGYQDDFSAPTLNPSWVVDNSPVYSVTNGVLRVISAAGDPNHLLYNLPGYNNTTQEVLTRIRILNFGTGDAPRGGVAVAVTAGGGGINMLFRDNGARNLALLDDQRAWGPSFGSAFVNNTWYWLRLRQEPNAASLGGANDVFAKYWRADGTEAEPAAWQATWDYTPTRTTRTGFAGVTASSAGGLTEMEVDYILIKATGLPSIVVNPDAFPAFETPVAITNQPQSVAVDELQYTNLTVSVIGTPPVTYRWYRNGALIPGATLATLNLFNVALTNDGAEYYAVVSNVASNQTHTVTSQVAVLSVRADTTGPVLREAYSDGLTTVVLRFSENLEPVQAVNLANYQLHAPGGLPVTISGVQLGEEYSEVFLTVEPLQEGTNYQVTLNNLTDQADARNAIAANTQANFIAVALQRHQLSGTTPRGSILAAGNGYDITGGGAATSAPDQGQFAYVLRSDNFDVRVRVAGLELSDSWARAALVARESLDEEARWVAAVATPSINGCFFQSFDAALSTQGAFPANHPYTWLRLQRVDNQFTAYAGVDGQSWTRLGSAQLTLPADLYLGFQVASLVPGQLTKASFRDFGGVFNPLAAPLPSQREPLGQSSRRTSLVISEIMYHPVPVEGITNSLEFVELFNSRAEPEDLGGYRLSGDVAYTFPEGTTIPAGGFLVVARFPRDLEQVYGLTNVLGPFTNNLSNNGGTVRLRHRTGAIFLETEYKTQPPWPVAADGAGHSLVLARPSYGEKSPQAWAASSQRGGSPGRLDPIMADPLNALVINEILARSTSLFGHDYIELYNRGAQPLDLSGCSLTDSPDTNKYVFPPGTTLDAFSFLYFSQQQLGFALGGNGETILLRHPDGRVLDALRYGPQAAEVAFGRSPDGAPHFAELQYQTPGLVNAPQLIRDVVINEIMYDPVSGNPDDQYVELFNKGTNVLDVGGWQFVDGIGFQFPANTLIPPQGFLVVARNLTNLLAKYPNLNASNTVGDFSGTLSKRSDRVALALFEASLLTNQTPGLLTKASRGNLIKTTIIDPPYNPQAYVVVDEVTYNTGCRWGRWSRGGGSSLELIDPNSDNRLAANWADSDEAAKAPWTSISFTGVLDLGNVSPDSLQVLPLGAGEYLLDDVRVLNASGVNVVSNSTFDANANYWVAEGTLSRSAWQAPSGTNSGCFLLQAVERGDNQLNRLRTTWTPALAANANATFQAKVRWLRGHPEMVLRLRGNWLETAVRLETPARPGTPGAPNSRLVANAPPALFEVSHYPVLPAAGETVRVTARAHDPHGVAAMTLNYRLDPATAYNTVPMLDDGTDGDEIAGDGLYSAMLPGQSARMLAAFYISATDSHPAPATGKFPADAPTRECLVRFGEAVPTGNFPAYRIWMTQNTFNTWDARNNLDNSPNDVTFVLSSARVIYNAEAGYAGSPYIAPGFNTPAGNRCGYTITLPRDDRLFGDSDLVLDWPGGHGRESTAIQEQMAYWLADRMGIPFSHRHFIRLYVNGVSDMQRGGVFEAVMQPGGDYLEQWSPDQPDGEFYKIDRAFEFSDTGGRTADPMPRLENYLTTGGQKKTARYRWTWLKRSYDSAQNYNQLFTLVDALNAAAPEPYTRQTELLADVEQWMGVFAFEHIINNFDSWGHEIGKNMYMFKPAGGKWVMYPFDLDWLMLVSPGYSSAYAAGGGSLFISEDPTVTKMYNHPPFRRAYLRAVQRAVDGPMLPVLSGAAMDAKHRALVANGITLCDGQALSNPDAVKQWFAQRRANLQTQLALAQAPFAVLTNSITTSNNVVTLTGTAPLEVATIAVNGSPWRPTWSSVSNWSLTLPVPAANNQLVLTGQDAAGQPLTGVTGMVSVTYTNAVSEPAGQVVFSELMPRPAVAGAEYVELFNHSANMAFDLFGWRINGLDYEFPYGTLLGPGQTLVLAKSREAFAAAYGPSIAVFDVYPGNLQADGETLTLFRPRPGNPAQEEIVDQARYGGEAPWPAAAGGAALQVVDPAQDHRRPLSWNDGASWRFFSVTLSNRFILPGQTNLMIQVMSTNSGVLYLDDLRIVNADSPDGTNLVANGNFEAPLEGTWNLGSAVTGSVLSTEFVHSGAYSLKLVATGRAQSLATALWQPINTVTGANYTISFWFRPSLEITNITVIANSLLTARPLSTYAPLLGKSPGASNAMGRALPPCPTLYLNEAQPENLTGALDNFGEREPWVEIFNGGANTVSLDGFYLTDDYTRLARWAFPTGTVIGPGQFLVVWADGQTNQTSEANLHAGFRLGPTNGSVALVMPLGNNDLGVLDYLNYTNIHPDHGYGAWPDGQPLQHREFYYATAGASNSIALPPLQVFINEWMADNATAVADPADNSYDDWFELYNDSDRPVDLAGFYLTDNLANSNQFKIPGGWIIPPKGFLLVWADNTPGQNVAGATNLHVNFALSRTGEGIALHTPDGALVHAVQFGYQPPNQSYGAWPDASGSAYALPQATPGAPNAEPFLGNDRPVIDPVPEQHRIAGQRLTVQFLATDPDWPPQAVVFSLGAEAPAGAAISPQGWLDWTPTPAQAGTNRFRILATDDGTPVMTGTHWLTVVVAPPPQLAAGAVNGGQFTVAFTTLPGKTYQVEYSESLANPVWLPLGGPQTATGNTLVLQDATAGRAQRFYRISVPE